MKKLTLAVGCATAFAAVLLTAAVLSHDFSPQDITPAPSPTPTAVTQSDEPRSAAGYVIGVYEGKIAVYTSSGALMQVYDVPVSTLPEYDREQLAIGVRVSDMASLRALIEDYTS